MSRYTNIHGEKMNRVEIAEMDAADDAHERKHEKRCVCGKTVDEDHRLVAAYGAWCCPDRIGGKS